MELAGLCLAAAAIFPLRAVALAAPTPRLRLAWNMLTATIFVCLCVRTVSTLFRMEDGVVPVEAFDAVVHLLGPGFVFAVAWLSRDTAKSLVQTRELERAASTDPLTGLPNRRQFEIGRKTAMADARATNRPVHLVLLDIDHFKSINDRFGHAAGDAVLTQFASLMAGALRAGDVAYRIGGEEFAILVPGLDAAAAPGVIDRLRSMVEAAPLAIGDGRTIGATVSIGAAPLLVDDTPEMLFQRADAELYAAKQAGRNRTRLAA